MQEIEFNLKDILYIVVLAVSVASTFFATRHKLKDYIIKRTEKLNDIINDMNVKLEIQNVKLTHIENETKELKTSVSKTKENLAKTQGSLNTILELKNK